MDRLHPQLLNKKKQHGGEFIQLSRPFKKFNLFCTLLHGMTALALGR
jgi:hypothetical protein